MPFSKGKSGNPAGRKPGSRNRATLAFEELLNAQAEALTQKAVELALAGQPGMLKLCLERLAPTRRGRCIDLAIGEIETIADLAAAQLKVVNAAASGELSPDEAGAISKALDSTRVALVTCAEQERLDRDEDRLDQDRAARTKKMEEQKRKIDAMLFPKAPRQSTV
jgi:hypothetical protein